jgi:hypothetical protein
MTIDVTEDWKLRQSGIDYNNGLVPAYYDTINSNERMFAGDQWAGVQANGLPKPVFNQFKRIINHFISSIMAQRITANVTGINVSKDGDEVSEMLAREVSGFATDAIGLIWERTKVDSMLRQSLLDMAITGDACMYSWFDMTKNTKSEIKGDISNKLIDSTNVHFGNPQDKEVQNQPYIIITMRSLVSDIKREAKQYKAGSEVIAQITPDDDTLNQTGDRSENDVEGNDEDSSKATVVMKLWKEYDKDGTCHVYCRKSTRGVVYRDKYDTKLRLYPIAWTNWDSRKNSFHGQSPCTGLAPNQIFINKLFAFVMVSLMNTAFPRLVYDKTKINAPTNSIGQMYGINGDVGGAMKYLDGAQMSGNVMSVIDTAIKYTKDMLGASDAFMGDIRPENKSAIIAVTKNAAIPLENIKANLYQFVEDMVLIWLDIMRGYYGERKIVRTRMGKSTKELFDFAALDSTELAVKVDVGASSYWSELGTVQTLDTMLQQKIITPIQYLERLPDTIFPNKTGLLEELKAGDKQKQVLYDAMGQFMMTLPPEQQQGIKNMPKEEQETAVLDMMIQAKSQQPSPNAVAPQMA